MVLHRTLLLPTEFNTRHNFINSVLFWSQLSVETVSYGPDPCSKKAWSKALPWSQSQLLVPWCRLQAGSVTYTVPEEAGTSTCDNQPAAKGPKNRAWVWNTDCVKLLTQLFIVICFMGSICLSVEQFHPFQQQTWITTQPGSSNNHYWAVCVFSSFLFFYPHCSLVIKRGTNFSSLMFFPWFICVNKFKVIYKWSWLTEYTFPQVSSFVEDTKACLSLKYKSLCLMWIETVLGMTVQSKITWCNFNYIVLSSATCLILVWESKFKPRLFGSVTVSQALILFERDDNKFKKFKIQHSSEKWLSLLFSEILYFSRLIFVWLIELSVLEWLLE